MTGHPPPQGPPRLGRPRGWDRRTREHPHAPLPTEHAESRLAAVVTATSDLVVVLDAEGVIRSCSPSLERRLGHPSGWAVGRTADVLLTEADARRLGLFGLARPAPVGPPVECHLMAASGAEVIVEVLASDLGAHGAVITMRESGERRRLERRLHRLERTDQVTGTANRVEMHDRLAEMLTDPGPSGALLVLDLDDFKLVNELYGHKHGDVLLVEAARRLDLVASQFEGSCLARLGGDEFALLLPEVSLQEARWVCAGLLNRLRQPVSLGAAEIEVGTSIGIVMLDSGRRDADSALRDGDLAMYAAKADGKNCWRLFVPAMHDDLVARVTLEGELAIALDEDQFELHFQPLVRLDGTPSIGVEALVRWMHPTRGSIPPDVFLPAAERGPLIQRLGAWVLRAACRQQLAWEADLGPDALSEVAVNVSPRQLMYPHFVTTVAEALAETGIDPSRLVLEITESTVMARNSQEQLLALRALGVRLSIDDFGTGHSSLARLAALPVDALKVDRAFVQAIPAVGDAPLVRAMVAMAHSLGLSVVAEGIETERQRRYLSDLGCEYGQGYFFSRPMPAAEVAAFLARFEWGGLRPVRRSAPILSRCSSSSWSSATGSEQLREVISQPPPPGESHQ